MFFDSQNLIFNLFIPENTFKNQYKILKTSKHHKIILKTKINQIKKLKEPDQLFSPYLGWKNIFIVLLFRRETYWHKYFFFLYIEMWPTENSLFSLSIFNNIIYYLLNLGSEK